jgi:hypothetical protein
VDERSVELARAWAVRFGLGSSAYLLACELFQRIAALARAHSRPLVVSMVCAWIAWTPSALGEATVSAASATCPALSATHTPATPPPGYAVLTEGYVSKACVLVMADDKVVPISTIPMAPVGTTMNVGGTALTGGDPVATVYQRTWDCCGILMTGLYTSLQWNAYGSYVVTTNQWNTTIYHQEAGGGGWRLDYQQLWYSAGCQNCASRTLSGKAGYAYRGVFDPTGLLYYNTDLNTMKGNGDGSWNCTYQYWWRASAPGWHVQNWCANGYNP